MNKRFFLRSACMLPLVQVDSCRIVHDSCVVDSRKDISGTAHVSSQLINLVEAPVHNRIDEPLIPEVPDHKIGCSGRAKSRKSQINSAHAKTFGF